MEKVIPSPIRKGGEIVIALYESMRFYWFNYIEVNMKKFDKEYKTQFPEEVKYLKFCGINYVFVKKENGIDTYKYTKTSELFNALAIFYENRLMIGDRNESEENNERRRTVDSATVRRRKDVRRNS